MESVNFKSYQTNTALLCMTFKLVFLISLQNSSIKGMQHKINYLR